MNRLPSPVCTVHRVVCAFLTFGRECVNIPGMKEVKGEEHKAPFLCFNLIRVVSPFYQARASACKLFRGISAIEEERIILRVMSLLLLKRLPCCGKNTGQRGGATEVLWMATN